jgi:crotonobetainyl-CoA:carnitine CoA-transferase CaiB-like acyl-CoA transferase
MLDVSTSMLANQASNFLATGEVPKRLGNQHPNIVPYQVGFDVGDVSKEAAWNMMERAVNTNLPC